MGGASLDVCETVGVAITTTGVATTFRIAVSGRSANVIATRLVEVALIR